MNQTNKLRDIRILSLYKQHYFDQYDTIMKCQYTCLGYYDGLEITRVDPENSEYKSALFAEPLNAAMPSVWCGTARNAENLKGKFGKQDIGIFRCIEEGQAEKWQKWIDNSPYFIVAFIQLESRNQYKNTVDAIESMSGQMDDRGAYITAVSYFTYDNADLIVFLYGNRIQKMDEVLHKIENRSEVTYLHSIFCISEEYLGDCRNSKKILEIWKGRNCFINDGISHIMLNIAAAGDERTAGKIKAQFRQLEKTDSTGLLGCSNLKFYHTFGHGNFIIDLFNTDVKSLLLLLQPDGLATHQNPLFGTEIYNIETTIRIRELMVTDEPILKKSKPDKKKLWFAKKVQEYEAKMKSIWAEDEGLYSYYCALVQTANTLAQYEGFSLAKDIFLLLFPAFEMFDKELNKKKCNAMITVPEKICMKNAIHEFVNAVNSIIYHTVHTDQVFLMIPGCSGTTFSIPVKLCLVYLNLIHDVITILNDQDYVYTCILTPELEIRPATSPIEVDRSGNDRLIRFTVSQRSLYMPRHFIILLTHEIAHYAGTDVRKRHLRLECISRTLAYLLAEGVCPENVESKLRFDEKKQGYAEFISRVKKEIREKSVKYIFERVNNQPNPKKEHSTVMVQYLKEACYELLEEKGVVCRLIRSIPREIYCAAKQDDIVEFSDRLNDIQNRMDQNRRKLFASRVIMDTCIDELVIIYKEIFSDVAAFEILNFDIQTFSETFNVSEGSKSNDDDGSKSYDIQRTVRQFIIERLNSNIPVKSGGQTFDNVEIAFNMENWPYSLADNLFSYCWTGKYLCQYAFTCAKEIQKRWKQSDAKDIIHCREEIRNIYNLFKNETTSCYEIYEKLIEAISSYERKVTENYIQELLSEQFGKTEGV